MSKQDKQNYEHLLTRIERLEEKVKFMEFLREHRADEIVISKELDVEDTSNEISVYANFLNYEKDRLIKLFLYSHPLHEGYRWTEEVVQHDERPYKFIHIRLSGLLSQVFKVDVFLEKVFSQDICLYAKAYDVPIDESMGGLNNGRFKKGSTKVDANTE